MAGVEGRRWRQRLSTCTVSLTLSLCAEEQKQGSLSAASHLAVNEQIGPANVYRPQIFLLAVSFAVGWEEVGRRRRRGSMKGEMTHFTSLSHSRSKCLSRKLWNCYLQLSLPLWVPPLITPNFSKHSDCLTLIFSFFSFHRNFSSCFFLSLFTAYTIMLQITEANHVCLKICLLCNQCFGGLVNCLKLN